MDTATLAARSEETVGTAPEGAPDQAGRLHLQGRQGPGPLRGQGEVAPPSRPVVLPGQPGRPRGDPAAARPGCGHRGGRHRQRGRGPAPRAEPRQAPPATLQRAVAGRQVVPVHRGHRRGRVPTRDVHARAAPSRRRLLRALCECEKGTRHAGRPEPRLSVPTVRGAEAGAAFGDPLPRLPHRALPRALRELHLQGGVRRDHRRGDRLPRRRHRADSGADRRADARCRSRGALRRGGAAPEPTLRGPAPGRAAGCGQARRRHDRRDRDRARRRSRNRADLPASRGEDDRPLRVPPRERRRARTSRPSSRSSASSTTARRRASRRRSSSRATPATSRRSSSSSPSGAVRASR